MQKFSDEPLEAHPGCGGAVERLISPPALQFKGSGWYVTDYGRSGKSPSAGNGRSTAANKAEPKTEHKPESKSEPKPAT